MEYGPILIFFVFLVFKFVMIEYARYTMRSLKVENMGGTIWFSYYRILESAVSLR
jgi:hypothetical protein